MVRKNKSTKPKPKGYFKKKGIGASLYKKRKLYRSKLNSIKVKNMGITSTFHQLKWGGSLSKTPKMKQIINRYKAGARNIYNIQSNGFLALSMNQQNVTQLVIGSVQQFKDCLNSVGIGPGGTGSVLNTARSLFTKLRGEYCFTNSSNAPCFADIYHFVCKRDCFLDPNSLVINGFKDETAQTVVNYATKWGVSPLDCVSLNTYWKCKDIVHVELMPGQTHVEKLVFDLNFQCNNELLNSANQADLYLGGYSHVFLIIARGTPSNIVSGAGSQISTTQANIIIAGNFRYEFKYIQDEETNFSWTSAGPGLTGTTANVYNPGTGTSIANVVI